MRDRSTRLVVRLDRHRVVVAAARSEGGSGDRVEVTDALVRERPEDVSATDASAVGAWLKRELTDAGLYSVAKRSGVIVSVARGEVVLKRLSVPESVASEELPDVVRLQMQRQLTVGADNPSIDFVRPGGDTRSVVAAALSSDRMAFLSGVMSAAGLKLTKACLESSGVSAAAAGTGALDVSERSATLVVSLMVGSTEFVLVENGRLVFARATDLDRLDAEGDAAAFARRVAVEARRTWMSFRMTHDDAAIAGVLVLSGDVLGREIAELCAETMDLAGAAAGIESAVTFARRFDDATVASITPLIGLLLEGSSGREVIDFRNPTSRGDKYEDTRKQVLAAAFVAVFVLGIGYTIQARQLGTLQRRLSSVQEERGRAWSAYRDHTALAAHRDQLDAWLAGDLDVLEHVIEVIGELPDDGSIVLDSISGRCESDMSFEVPSKRTKSAVFYADGEWVTRDVVRLTVSGKAREQAEVDRIREGLAQTNRYTVTTPGADVPGRFAWRLSSVRRAGSDEGGASE